LPTPDSLLPFRAGRGEVEPIFRAYGLYSHIRANRLRSAILLAGFVALLHALLFSLLMVWSALYGGTFQEIVEGAWWQFRQSWPVAMIAAAVWFVITTSRTSCWCGWRRAPEASPGPRRRSSTTHWR